MKKDTILAWHFGDRCLGYGDNRIIRVGIRQRFKSTYKSGELVMCRRGLHASIDILDALSYARGNIIRRVELSGSKILAPDKICAEYRRTLWAVSGEKLLIRFACLCALDVKGNWKRPIPDVLLRWLHTQDEAKKNEACFAARSGADSAADSAARFAARSAAYSAANSAAYSAAYSAANSAAYSAAYCAAHCAADSAAYCAADSAADSAACFAARSAIRNIQKRRLLRMIHKTKRGKS